MLATSEGGCLVDVAGIAEMVPDNLEDPDEVRAAMEHVLDAGWERCGHGLSLWADLAVGEPFEARPGLRVGVDLDLLAGPAMGSGHEPWTRAGLEAVERCQPAGAIVADVGAGSGILGLYALRLGAARADGVDVDPLSVAVARRNARVNGLGERYTARVGSLDALQPGHYGLVLLALPDEHQTGLALPAAAALLHARGRLVLSPAGGAPECAALAEQARRLGLDPDGAVEVEGWHALIAKRTSPY
jgi:ribosomal protein L11 methyltransferase